MRSLNKNNQPDREEILQKKSEVELLMQENEKLQSLLSVSESIMSEIHLDALLQKIMSEVTKVMDADRSTLFLLDNKTNELWSKVAQGEGVGEIRFPANAGIAGHVATSGEIVNITEAYEDPRFNKGIDKKTGYRTKSILAIPMYNSAREIIGVMQVLNKQGEIDYFTSTDEDLLRAFSSIAAISLENAFVYEQVHNTMKTFELFVPRQFLNRIAQQGLESIRLGGAQEEVVSILFSDIREFTSLSEAMSADETLNFLNSYLKRMAGVITRYEGAVDKFIGDAIMAVFDQKSANNCVHAALGMRDELQLFNRMRHKAGFLPIEIGIGINTGPTIIGTIGTVERMDSTVIGDTVNLASRLEGLTKLYGIPLLVTEDTLRHLDNPDKYFTRLVDTVIVKGRKGSTSIYEVFNYDPAEVVELKLKSAVILEEARTLYRERRWEEAVAVFRRALEVYPVDMVAWTFIHRCEVYQKLPPPEGWDGSFKLDEK